MIICGVAAGWVEIDSALVESLQDLLALVREHNPFQRARLAGADPAALPLLTKRELLDDQALHPPFGTNLTYPLDRYVRLFKTSGITGPPLKVLDTAEDWAWRRERYEHTLRAAGVGPGDRVALAFSFGPYAHGWNSSEGLAGVGALAVPLGGMSSVQRLQTIAEVEATVVWCTPTYALRLLEVALAERLEAALESVRLVLCGGEPGASLPGTRARIEEGFGARCLEHFGLTEVGPLAYPCSAGHGMHVDERDFVCEFLGAELEPVPAGERGELVVTPLRRTGFPVLRYRTGDVVVRSASRCPAGHADLWLPRRDRRAHGRHGRHPRHERVPVRDRGGRAPRQRLRRVPDHVLLRRARDGRDQARGRAPRGRRRARSCRRRCGAGSACACASCRWRPDCSRARRVRPAASSTSAPRIG